MKRYMIAAVALTLNALICFNFGISHAQEEEETEYSYGTVSSVSSNQIVVNEYDYDKEQEVKVTYVIDPKAVLNNVDSVGEIAVGDDVEIDYVIKDGKNVAKAIFVEKPLPEEPYPEEEKHEPLEIY